MFGCWIYVPTKHSSIRGISLDMFGNVYRCVIGLIQWGGQIALGLPQLDIQQNAPLKNPVSASEPLNPSWVRLDVGYICQPNILLSEAYLWICLEMYIVARVPGSHTVGWPNSIRAAPIGHTAKCPSEKSCISLWTTLSFMGSVRPLNWETAKIILVSLKN